MSRGLLTQRPEWEHWNTATWVNIGKHRDLDLFPHHICNQPGRHEGTHTCSLSAGDLGMEMVPGAACFTLYSVGELQVQMGTSVSTHEVENGRERHQK